MSAAKESAVNASKKIREFCLKNGLSDKKAQYMELLTEETVEHIRRFNIEKKPQIDLFCSIMTDKIILRLRDNGEIFDPSVVDDDEEEFSNLKMIHSVADNVEYTRVIGFNNMLVELGR